MTIKEYDTELIKKRYPGIKNDWAVEKSSISEDWLESKYVYERADDLGYPYFWIVEHNDHYFSVSMIFGLTNAKYVNFNSKDDMYKFLNDSIDTFIERKKSIVLKQKAANPTKIDASFTDMSEDTDDCKIIELNKDKIVVLHGGLYKWFDNREKAEDYLIHEMLYDNYTNYGYDEELDR
jgi:hypothetical protein